MSVVSFLCVVRLKVWSTEFGDHRLGCWPQPRVISRWPRDVTGVTLSFHPGFCHGGPHGWQVVSGWGIGGVSVCFLVGEVSVPKNISKPIWFFAYFTWRYLVSYHFCSERKKLEGRSGTTLNHRIDIHSDVFLQAIGAEARKKARRFDPQCWGNLEVHPESCGLAVWKRIEARYIVHCGNSGWNHFQNSRNRVYGLTSLSHCQTCIQILNLA